MAIIKKVAKNGRLIYYDESKGRFTNASSWVRQNYDIIGPGRSKIIDTNGLTDRERRVFYGLRQSRETYRYNGRFLDKDTGMVLKALGIGPGEVRDKVSRGLLATIIDTQTEYTIKSFIGPGAGGQGEYWELKSGTFDRSLDDINSAIRRGYDVTVIDRDGIAHKGREGVKVVALYEMEMFLGEEKKVRIEHLVRYLPSRKQYKIDLRESQVTWLGQS